MGLRERLQTVQQRRHELAALDTEEHLIIEAQRQQAEQDTVEMAVIKREQFEQASAGSGVIKPHLARRISQTALEQVTGEFPALRHSGDPHDTPPAAA